MGLTVYGGGGKPEEEKTVTAGTSAIVVNPSSGKVMKKVTVNPTPTESKEVTAGTSDTTVSPTEGKHLSGVTVHPTPSQEKTVIPTADGFKVSPETGKLLSAVFVYGDSDLVPKNIKQGISIFGVDGSFDNSHGAYVWNKKRFYTKYPHSLSNLDYYIYVDTSVSDYSKLYFDLKNLPVFPTDIYDFLNGFKIYDQGNALRYTLEYVDGVMYANRSHGVTATITVSGTRVYIKMSKRPTNWAGTYGHIRYDGEKILYEDNVVGEIVGFVVSDDASSYPDGAVHTDGYYYELLGQVTSANVMSLSDNAVATVQQDYRDTIETEVSNANS